MDAFLAHAPLFIPLILALGLGAGFLAGLLGIGGGIILVPGLYFIFKTLSYAPQNLMHMALATSLAIIIPTGLSSAFAHFRRGAVDMNAIRVLGPGIVLGVTAGIVIADMASGRALLFLFAAALGVLAALMQIPPPQNNTSSFPRTASFFAGMGIGTLSSLMGIGGATLNVPYMTLNGLGIHRAVASSAALGPVIAIPATLGYVWIGLREPGLPPYTLGYIHLLAVALIIPFSVLAAPLGARCAHALPITSLRRIFAAFLLLVAAKMAWEAFHA